MTEQAVFGRRGVDRRPAPSPRLAPTPAPLAAPQAEERAGWLAAIPLTTVGLILGLCAIFALQRATAFDAGPDGHLSTDSLVAQGADMRNLTLGAGEIWRMALAPLLHSSPSHLFGNCLALLLIGVSLEPMIGRGWFAGVFVASAVGGEIGSLIGIPPYIAGVGASGAISGLLAAGLVTSFSAQGDDARRMRNRALFFGVPALAPLLWGAHDHTNYYAHLGGALVGGAMALFVEMIWDKDQILPPGRRIAGAAAAVGVLLSLGASAVAATQYDARRIEAAQFIPMAELNGDMRDLAKKALEFQRRYPNDPMTRILTGLHDVFDGQLAAGEVALRAAMTMEVPSRPWSRPMLHTYAQGVLAVTLTFDRRRGEAQALATPICGRANVMEMLRKAKLCP
jgi:membrane associated rhomboid family serine protease